MKNFNIMITSIADVKDFVSITSLQNFEVDLVSGRYTIDAKSIMGIFSLDLSKALNVDVHGSDEEAAKYYKLVEKYVVWEG